MMVNYTRTRIKISGRRLKGPRISTTGKSLLGFNH